MERQQEKMTEFLLLAPQTGQCCGNYSSSLSLSVISDWSVLKEVWWSSIVSWPMLVTEAVLGRQVS